MISHFLCFAFALIINIAHLVAGTPIQFLNFAESASNINAVCITGSAWM